jgi:hypothetical protein
MEVRLSRAEYWLLETVVTFTTPLHYLVAENLEQILNKPTHGLPAQRLIDVLAGLFDRGWIEADGFEDETAPRPLDRQEIARALAQPVGGTTEGKWRYQLTAAGGAVWESFAAPDWDRFLDIGIGMPEDGGEFIGASEKRLRRYLALVHHQGYRVVPGSEQWDVVRPWQATYWKELPAGHRVRFSFTYDDRTPRWDGIPHEVILLTEWYRWD